MITSAASWSPLPRQPTTGCAYVARVALTVTGGRQFRPGDDFPYADLGLDEFRAYQMWQAAQLDVKEPTIEPAQSGTMQTATVQAPSEQRDRKHKRRW